MENDVNELFRNFQKQVDEIASHAPQVARLKFSAELKNGTGFHFTYNADTFGKEKRPYKPLSIFNAIGDIIGCGVAITLLVLHFSRPLWAVSMALATTIFVTNAIMHLMDVSRQRTIGVLSHLVFAMKVIFLCLLNFATAGGPQSVTLTTLGLSALSLLLFSMQTRGAEKAGAIFLSAIPFMNMLGKGGHSLLLLAGADLLLALWALFPALLGQRNRGRSSSVLAVIGIILASLA